MSETAEVQININQKPFLVEAIKNISYDDVLKVTKLPKGATVFYIDTKAKPSERRTGYLVEGQSIKISDGLNISAFTRIQLEEGEDA